MVLIPRRDYVVIKAEVVENKTTTASGILLATKASNEDRQQIGKIVAVGQGIFLEDGKILPLGLEIGDEVLFNKYAGTEIKLDEEVHILLHDKDIIAIVK